MLRRLLHKCAVSFLLAVVAVSYSERWQVQLFAPLRNALVASEEVIDQGGPDAVQFGLTFKGSEDGYYVNPWMASSKVVVAAEHALASDCLALPDKDVEALLLSAGYFLESAESRTYRTEDRHFSVWTYPIRFLYGLEPGWISAMAQGRIAVVLAGASKCAKEEAATAYANLSRLAVNSFEVAVEDGGVLVSVDGGNWYEEYAQAGVEPPLVLNGHVYAVLSLHQLRAFDSRAEGLFSSGISALTENLHHYDAQTWSYYDRRGTPANNIYQQPLHAGQMNELFELTGKPIFRRYHKKFSAQRMSPFSSIQRLAMRPSRFLWFLLVVNFALFLSFAAVIGKLMLRARV